MMSNKVYVISWIGEYENNVIGVYTTLEKAKHELAKIASSCTVVSYGYENLSFSTIDDGFYCIDETILHS